MAQTLTKFADEIRTALLEDQGRAAWLQNAPLDQQRAFLKSMGVIF